MGQKLFFLMKTYIFAIVIQFNFCRNVTKLLDRYFGDLLPPATMKNHLSEEVLYTNGKAEPVAGNPLLHKSFPFVISNLTTYNPFHPLYIQKQCVL
jgi:hypothetical protein